MSGIAGIVNLDGAPVDRALLERMTRFMAYRGPDGQEVWQQGPVGFGHALLRATDESATEWQPCSLDGQNWITADARIDARPELIRELQPHGRHCAAAAADCELILHAYAVWGEECVQHLLGDFAFAIWDGRARRLFCARDHFGIKPFCYAQASGSLVFSNTLDAIRLHPLVPGDLNDQAIADFLLFGWNLEFDSTAFSGIFRLPPAHTLAWSEGGLRIRRYWALPLEEPVRYSRPTECVKHFQELLRTAVSDRLRTSSVGVLMSGGLDSTSVAATAKELLSRRPSGYDLRAHTAIDEEASDEEGHYAGLVAGALGIPIHYLSTGGYNLFERCEEPEFRQPEPADFSVQATGVDLYRQAASHGRVLLTGQGGDPIFHPQSWPYIAWLAKHSEWVQLAREVGGYILSHRTIPPPLIGLRTRLRRMLRLPIRQSPYPTWLHPEFESRMRLRDHWNDYQKTILHPASSHPTRPGAYEELTHSFWPHNFESEDAGMTHFPLEVRHPLFDLRLVRFVLALPPVPWCVDKKLLRLAMSGVLPEVVRRRPKSPLAQDPALELLKRSKTEPLDGFEFAKALDRYVDRDRFPQLTSQTNPLRLFVDLRAISLNYWLQSNALFQYKMAGEAYYEGRPSRQKALPDSSAPYLRRHPGTHPTEEGTRPKG